MFFKALLPPKFPDHLRLERSDFLDSEMIELSAKLPVKLNEKASKSSLERLQFLKFESLSYYTVFIVSTIVGITVFILNGLAFFSNPNTSKFAYILSPLILPAFFAFAAIFGFIMMRKTVRSTSNPLHSIADLFQKKDMDEKWEHFLAWAKTNNLVVYVELASSEYIPIPVEIWQKKFVHAFILGSKGHRRLLVDGSQNSLEPLVVRAEDWKGYQETMPEVVSDKPPVAEVDKHNSDYDPNRFSGTHEEVGKSKEPKTVLESEEPKEFLANAELLQIRQKLRGKNTGWCPRLEVICGYEGVAANEVFLMKAWEKSKLLPTWKLSEADVQARAVLGTTVKNFNRRHEFFGAKPATAKEKQDGNNLETLLRIDLDATTKNEKRVKNLRFSKWNPMEQYLEKLGFISDIELYELNPKFQKFVDSGPLGIKILS